jgi:transposase
LTNLNNTRSETLAFQAGQCGWQRSLYRLEEKATAARRIRRLHNPKFKARIALQTFRETRTTTQLCQEYELHANQIIDCKRQLNEGSSGVFGTSAPKPMDTSALEAKIG